MTRGKAPTPINHRSILLPPTPPPTHTLISSSTYHNIVPTFLQGFGGGGREGLYLREAPVSHELGGSKLFSS